MALNYAEYTKGLDKSDQAALKFAQNTQKSFDAAAASTKEFFVGIATGAAAAAVAYVGIGASIQRFTGAIDTLARLDDMAQKTGSSIENLSRLQKTAEAFGHDFEGVDSVLVKLSRGMATADSDTNRVNKALKALGISSRDAAGNLRDPSEVMLEIAKNLQQYEDGAAKTALATDALGKSGADNLPFINDLADNVHRFGAESAESAKLASEYQDRLGMLKQRVSQLFTGFAVDLLPTLSKVAKAMLDSADGTGGFSKAADYAGGVIKRLTALGAAAGFVFVSTGKIVSMVATQLSALARLDFKGVFQGGIVNELAQDFKDYSEFVDKILADTKAVEEVQKRTEENQPKKKLKYESGDSDQAKKIEQLNEASRKYLENLKTETLAVGENAVRTKLLAAAKQAAATPSKELAMAIMTEAQAWGKLAQFQEDAKNEFAKLEAREDAFREASNSILDYSRATDDANAAAQFEIDLMGKSAQEREVALAQRKAELDLKKQILAITDQVSNADDREALIEEANAIGERAIAAARLQAMAKSTMEEWERIGQTIEQTGKNAFVQFAAHGVSAMKSIGQAIKLSIIDVLYQLTIRKWIINIGTSIVASMGSTGANAGLFSNQSLSSGISGLGSIASSIGSLFGSAGSVFGAGVGTAGASAGTALIGGAGTALGGTGLSGGGGLAGLGSMFSGASAALPIVGAMFGLGALGSSFGAGKSIFGIKGDSILNYLPFAPGLIGILAGLFGKGPKQYGPQLLNGNFTESGFSGNFQADWTRKVGIFGGKKRGTTDFPISPEQVNSLNETVTGITDVFDTLIKTTGDADRSLSGWTFNVRRQIDTEEQQKQLTDDLANSIGQKLVPELEALKQKGESLADTAARAQQEFKLMTAAIDLTGQSFGSTGLASLGLRDNLVQLLGGIQNAGSLLQPFFENFYTDAERAASTGRIMNAELEKLGVTTIPQTKDQFRALVEAQDLSTDAGQKMFAALIQLAPAFVTVSDAAQKVADDATAAAKKLADSIQLLTTGAFRTLFDYTKYIRLAANSGITAAQPAGPVFQPSSQTYMPSFAVGANELPGDMTAKVHKGERIIPAADNRELMRRLSSPDAANDALLAEIRQLRAELKAAHAAIAKNTSRTAKILDTFDGNGMPPVRT